MLPKNIMLTCWNHSEKSVPEILPDSQKRTFYFLLHQSAETS